MCRALEVSSAGYYRWRGRKPSARATENERLAKKIKAAHIASRGLYGSPKIYRGLRREGEAVNHKRVSRLMKEHGIKAKRVKKSRRTTDSRHGLPVAENVLARNFKVERPDEVWTREHHLRLDSRRVALPRGVPRPLLASGGGLGSFCQP